MCRGQGRIATVNYSAWTSICSLISSPCSNPGGLGAVAMGMPVGEYGPWDKNVIGADRAMQIEFFD